MKNLKKYLAATLAIGAFVGVQPAVSEAAYELSSEVKTATPALLNASQIGVMTNENAAMANAENKDAILVMSFGTTFKETRQATIEATVKQIEAAHPGVKVVTAFTSHIIIDRIKANEGITYPTPEEALEQLKKEGYTRVAMTSLDIIPGMEYSYKLEVFRGFRDNFKKATFGTSLMYWMGQEEQADDVDEAMKALATQFPKLGKQDAVLIMALEAIEGTDACIKRGGQLAKGGAVVAKAAKPKQDNRFDVPAVGTKTLESMIEVGAKALVIEAGKTLLVEKEKVVELAEANGITIVAME